MYSKMCPSMWFISIVALLVVDVQTGALQQETQPHRCYQCSPTNNTACEHHASWLTATCPGSRPYCATIAQAPDFSSSLGCAAAADEACSLTNSPRQTLELTCICIGHLCNAPFSNKLRNELLNFSSNSNESALTEAFFKLSNFTNITTDDIYKAITVATAEVSVSNVSEVTLVRSVVLGSRGSSKEMIPRAEALKQQATAPSDDDEDEGEGSGADEADRARSPSHTAAAPAPPSSYLPSHDHNAAHIFIPSLFTPILLTSFVF